MKQSHILILGFSFTFTFDSVALFLFLQGLDFNKLEGSNLRNVNIPSQYEIFIQLAE